ncbi:DNA adenine methylase [Rhodopirellula sp.]|nr:DNA adenine methylase [Rhodopirellula sp.]
MRYPPFKWHGGKSPYAKEIVALMDGVEHLNYLEPYFGAGSVLLAKAPNGKSEIANDIYSHLFDFFSVLRDQELYQELISRCELTPVSEKSWQEAVEMLSQENLPQVERAYAFYVSVQQSRQGLQNDFLTPTYKRLRGNRNAEVNAYLSGVDRLPEYHKRLQNVMFFNRDAIEVIQSQDCESRLIYADPPYVTATREAKDVCACEMNDQDHHNLVAVFLASKSKVMLSGYPGSEAIYQRLEQAGWGVWSRGVVKHSSSQKVKPKVFEQIWANFELNTQNAPKWERTKRDATSVLVSLPSLPPKTESAVAKSRPSKAKPKHDPKRVTSEAWGAKSHKLLQRVDDQPGVSIWDLTPLLRKTLVNDSSGNALRER